MTVDPYYLKGYVQANALVDKGSPELFVFQDSLGIVEYPFILRDIESDRVPGARDIITPYGYGGPRVRDCTDEQQRADLIAGFESSFVAYCKAQNIVSEFVRFHPFEESVRDFGSKYNLRLDRETVATSLLGEDMLGREVSKSARKRARRNEKLGISVQIGKLDQIEEFIELYRSTMERNNAADFYYFTDTFFQALHRELGEHLIAAEARLDGVLIGAALCLVGAGRIHIHLSGTDPEYLTLSPATSIRVELARWGQNNGYQWIHHGGGRTRSESDGLLAFKSRFGSVRREFFLGTRVWNQELYSSLCEEAEVDVGSAYFPAYRSRDK